MLNISPAIVFRTISAADEASKPASSGSKRHCLGYTGFGHHKAGRDMKSFFAALIAFSLLTTPAAAYEPVMKLIGADFLQQCAHPPANRDVQVVTACAVYVAGLADEAIYAGRICLPADFNPQSLLPVALNWLRLRSQNQSYPAGVQIRTGLTALYGCQPMTRSIADERLTMQDTLKLGRQWLEIYEAAKPIIAVLVH